MLQVSLQHWCWASYQIAEQVTIVNLVALCGSWGIVLDNDLKSNRRPGPGEGTQSMKVITYAPPFSGLWEICMVSTPIFDRKWGKCCISTPFSSKFDKCIASTHFLALCSNWVNGRCWESLSETQPRTPSSERLYRGSPVNMWLTGHLSGTVKFQYG